MKNSESNPYLSKKITLIILYIVKWGICNAKKKTYSKNNNVCDNIIGNNKLCFRNFKKTIE